MTDYPFKSTRLTKKRAWAVIEASRTECPYVYHVWQMIGEMNPGVLEMMLVEIQCCILRDVSVEEFKRCLPKTLSDMLMSVSAGYSHRLISIWHSNPHE